MLAPDPILYDSLIEAALKEDLSFGDFTTEALIPSDLKGLGVARAKEELVFCGFPVALSVFHKVDPELEVRSLVEEGSEVSAGEALFEVSGRVASILKAERVALIFIQHLSGIATLTRKFVKKLADLPVKVVDTRKTTPGLRILEKYAVRVGGGSNHRFGLSEGILIKDNHVKACGGVKEALARARTISHLFRIEIEVKTLTELREAISAGAEVVLLDNMSLEELKEAVKLARSLNPKIILEASGGVTLENVRAIAETGVDLISVGRLTHSARAMDINLKIEKLFI